MSRICSYRMKISNLINYYLDILAFKHVGVGDKNLNGKKKSKLTNIQENICMARD